MNKIKKFDLFISELKGSTYIKAGEKLIDKGHKDRGKNLTDYGKEQEDFKKNNYYYDAGGTICEGNIEYLIIRFHGERAELIDQQYDIPIISFKTFNIITDDGTQQQIVEIEDKIICDRKSAFKIFKWLKNTLGDRLSDKITVNDLYEPKNN